MAIKALDRKLLRDLWHLRGQALAIALVLMCGVATFIMFLSTLHALRATQEAYYRQYRFADLFVSLKRAPDALAARLASIDGVAQAQTRVVAQVRLAMPGFDEPVLGLMVSAPQYGRASLNALYLAAGRLPDDWRADEVVASKPFADAHRLRLGDTFTAFLNGRRQHLRLVGTALSPEFIEQMRPGAATPDYQRFGVLWMARRALAQAYDMHGAFNDATFTLAPGADGAAVISRIDRLLAPYGGLGAVGRDEQRSHRFLSQELGQLATLGTLFPSIFLGVAAYLINVVMARLVATERPLVATLKALGYGNGAVMAHYLKLVALIAAAGIVAGSALGTWLGAALAGVYRNFYHFPYLRFAVPPATVLAATTLCLLAAAGGAALAIRRTVALRPAEAMRAPAPARYRVSWLERLGAGRLLSQPARMIVRHLQRQYWQALLTVFGVALGGGIILTGLFQRDTVSYMLDLQFRHAQRDDLAVLLTEPTAARARFELQALPGVRRVEVYRAVPVRLRFGAASYRTAIRGSENPADGDGNGDARGGGKDTGKDIGKGMGKSNAAAIGEGSGSTGSDSIGSGTDSASGNPDGNANGNGNGNGNANGSSSSYGARGGKIAGNGEGSGTSTSGGMGKVIGNGSNATGGGGHLQRLLDVDLRPVALPAQGMLLTDFLAQRLGVVPGQLVEVEVLEGRRPHRRVALAGVVREYIGVGAYMRLDALNALLHEGPTISGAWLGADSSALPALYRSLSAMPRVAGMARRVQEILNFQRMMEQTMLFFSSIATAFAVIIAFGVIYNSARIALTERGHELASLRVLGFTRGEIAFILLGELAVLIALAVPLGLLLGWLMCYYIAHALQNELYRVPVVLATSSYAFAVCVVLVAAALSALAVRRRLDRLDLIAVLKTAQ